MAGLNLVWSPASLLSLLALMLGVYHAYDGRGSGETKVLDLPPCFLLI